MKKVKVIAVSDISFDVRTMPVFRALDYCGSYPIPDKSKKPIYSDIFFDSKSSLLQAEHKRNRKKSLLEKS